jgi:hypothetical protein
VAGWGPVNGWGQGSPCLISPERLAWLLASSGLGDLGMHRGEGGPGNRGAGVQGAHKSHVPGCAVSVQLTVREKLRQEVL